MQTANQKVESQKTEKKGQSAWWLLGLHATWLILLGVGAWYGYTSWKFASEGREVDAVVIALDESSDSDGATTYSPVFEYTVGGQTYQYESVNSSNPPTHRLGQRTTLLVMEDDPEKARENSFWELWLLPVIMCPISLGLAVISIILNVTLGFRKK